MVCFLVVEILVLDENNNILSNMCLDFLFLVLKIVLYGYCYEIVVIFVDGIFILVCLSN